MPSSFSQTPYFKAQFSLRPLLENLTKCQPRYGNANEYQFNQHYSSDGWLGRKVTALPMALWSALIKTAYTVAHFILHLPSASADKGKIYLFKIGRNFQESYGRIASLFNDKYGQYHIQESEFHKNCYDWFLETGRSKGLQLSQWSKEEINSLFTRDLDRISAEDMFSVFSPEEVERAIANGLLNNYQLSLLSLHQINGLKAEAAIISIVKSLSSLASGNEEESVVRDATRRFSLLDRKAIKSLLERGDLDSYNLSLVSNLQLRHLDFGKLSDATRRELFQSKDTLMGNNLHRFANFSAASVQSALKSPLLTHGSKYWVELISDDQLKGLKLSTIPNASLELMYLFLGPVKPNWFSHFSVEEIKAAFTQCTIKKEFLVKNVQGEQVKGIRLSALPDLFIGDMFPRKAGLSANREKFRHLDPADIQASLDQGEFPEECVELISDHQFSQFDFANASQTMINCLFPDSQRESNTKRISQLSDKQRKDLESRLYQNDPLKKDSSTCDEFFGNFLKEEKSIANAFSTFFNYFGQESIEIKPKSAEDYQQLELSADVSVREVRKAYKKLALKYHPDRISRLIDESDDLFALRKTTFLEKFKQVSLAYTRLSSF